MIDSYGAYLIIIACIAGIYYLCKGVFDDA